MPKPRTHFEQVPLEIIKKIIADPIPPKLLIKADKASRSKKQKKSLLPSKQQSKAACRIPSRIRLTKQ